MDVLREIATRLGLSKKDTVVRVLSATLAAGSGAAVNVPNVYAGSFSQNEAPVQAGVAESPDAQVGAPSGILNRSEAARLALERSRKNGKGWDRVEEDDKVVITRNDGVFASYQFPGAEYKFMIDRPDDVKAVTDINQDRMNGELIYIDPFPGRIHPSLGGVNFNGGVSMRSSVGVVQFKLGRELNPDEDSLSIFVTFQEPTAVNADSKVRFESIPLAEQKDIIRRFNRFVGERIALDGESNGESLNIPEVMPLVQATEDSPSAIVLVPVA